MNRIALSLLAGVAGLAIASSAHAADLIIDTPPAPGIIETTSGNWDGLYLGVFTGYGWGTFDVDPDLDDETDDVDASGWLLGLDVGANFSLGSGVVAGIVGDIAWSNITNDDEDYSINWAGSVRGRLGLDAGTFMPYLTGGLAVAGAEIADEEQTHVGWTVGAGVEVALADNLSLDALYRYSDYGTQTYDGTDVGLTTNQVTVGLHWKF